jgi:hypothetical protein
VWVFGGLVWFITGNSEGSCEHGNENSGVLERYTCILVKITHITERNILVTSSSESNSPNCSWTLGF